MSREQFIRLHGCGNSFIVVFDGEAADFDWRAASARLLDPHFGLGTDGLMVVSPARGADFEVRMFNPDGSPMGMCGNGIRCVTRALFLEGLAPGEEREIAFVVEGRRVVCLPLDEGRMVRVDMGAPSFAPADLPVVSDKEWIDREISVSPAGQRPFTMAATCVSMGNPHCVMFPPDLSAIDLNVLGPAIERAPIFPQRSNVEFVEVRSPERLRVRVWERGAGATLACGTGACASLVAAARTGRSGRRAKVELPGGELEIEWLADRVLMTGPARDVCRGTFSPEFLKPASSK
jgi:diaminopimelate epimerase